MARLTQYGSVYGAIPAFSGRIIYVAPGAAGGGSGNTATYTVNGQSFGASDGNDGLSPERALASLTQALAIAATPTAPSSPSLGTSAAAGTFDDVIVMLPGLHNVDANTLVAPKYSSNRLLITGVPGTADFSARTQYPITRLRTRLQTSASLDLLQLQGNDLEIAYLQFNPFTAKNAISLTAACVGVNIHDCIFNAQGVAASVSTKCIKFGAFVQKNIDIVRNTFMTDAAQGPWIDMAGSTSTDISILGNFFNHNTGTLAVGVQCAAGLDRCIYADNTHICSGGGTVTVGVDGTNTSISGGMYARNNYFNSQGYVITTCFKNFGATNTILTMNNNFFGSQSSAGTGIAQIVTAT